VGFVLKVLNKSKRCENVFHVHCYASLGPQSSVRQRKHSILVLDETKWIRIRLNHGARNACISITKAMEGLPENLSPHMRLEIGQLILRNYHMRPEIKSLEFAELSDRALMHVSIKFEQKTDC